MHPLKKIVSAQKNGQALGIYSACTANSLVLEACLEKAKATHSLVLIEATANQVDQNGGYTGMKPKDFRRLVESLADQVGLPHNQIILGGDHLGPLTFSQESEEEAMANAKELVRQYVAAGFTKIHIDTSMKVASDDPSLRLTDETIARRGALLAKVAEEAYQELLQDNPQALHPVYVIGSEVPIPGGSQEAKDTGLSITKPADMKATVAAFQKAFETLGLQKAWEEVIAVVVQPGVEEKDSGCTPYDRSKATTLMAAIKKMDHLVYEGHSTDYQTKINLRELVEDGVGILKVGPGLTFALREALFALAFAEKEAYRNQEDRQSHFMEVLDTAMVENPTYYKKYYFGTPSEIAFKRKYSFSDRCRYYLPLATVETAQRKLFDNFKEGVPLALLSQFLPLQYTKVKEGLLLNRPEALVKDYIGQTIDNYLYATHQEELK